MNTDAGCPFCVLASGPPPAHCVFEDERFFVLLNRKSLNAFHCMIIPRRHVEKIYELPGPECDALFRLARGLAPGLERAAGKKATCFITFGSGIAHAHLQLIPHNHPKEILDAASARRLSDTELATNAIVLKGLIQTWREE